MGEGQKLLGLNGNKSKIYGILWEKIKILWHKMTLAPVVGRGVECYAI